MMKIPVTQAVRMLRKHRIEFTPRVYEYQDGGGAKLGAQSLSVPLSHVIKTLIMETDTGKPLIALMHGDKEVSTKALARYLQVKSVTPCKPDTADKHSGYVVGGTSPFGTRAAMPVYIEAGVLELPRVFINGGKRGFLIELESHVLLDLLSAEPVDMAQ